MIDLENLTITKAREAFARRDFSVAELTSAYLAAIEKKNPELNAYREAFPDALTEARAIDVRLASGEKGGPLTGIPLALKDNILLEGHLAGASAKILEGYRATYDATVVARLKKAGALFLGRTNMDEFAMGASTENSAYGVTKNPRDTSRVAGGSSGGSAAAVAADLALASLGTDTGGSVRQPASFCGVVGLRPTYGALSRHGLIAMASSLDQPGPITKTVEDTEILFNAMRGRDPLDSTSIDIPASSAPVKKIGVPVRLLDDLDRSVLGNFEESVAALKRDGYEIEEIELPHIAYALPAYYITVFAEVSSNLARFDGMRYGALKEGGALLDEYMRTRGEGFGREVRRRILLGTFVLSAGYYDAYYAKAIAGRGLIKDDFRKAFEVVDAIITPTTPHGAFKIGEKGSDPVQMYLEDIFTVPASVAGLPALTVPGGAVSVDGASLPLGLQMTGPHGREDALFALGKKFSSGYNQNNAGTP